MDRNENKVLASVREVTAWLRPVILPYETEPENWTVVRLPNGQPGYIESKFLK